jgi:hypothetical protein
MTAGLRHIADKKRNDPRSQTQGESPYRENILYPRKNLATCRSDPMTELSFPLRCLFVIQEAPMKNPWLVVASLFSLSLPVHCVQANTPQGALEEIATADKPEVLVRHLPEPIQKRIEALPKPKKSEVMSQLMQMKAQQFDYCTVRRANGADTWEIVDKDGDSKGTVQLENAFISGLDAFLPLHITSPDTSDTLIVMLHLEGNEWRIQNFAGGGRLIPA